MRNIGLKLWSALLAISLALYVYGQSNSSLRTIVLPVEHKNLPSNLVILRPNERNIKVTLRGPAHVLAQIIESPPSVVVRFPDGVLKSHRVVFQQTELPIPASVEVLSIDPPEVDYVLDSLISKELTVIVPSFGVPPRSRILSDLRADPAKVEIRGPETILSIRTEIETDPLDLRQLLESGSKEMRLSSSGELLNISQKTVLVHYTIEKQFTTKVFNNVPIIASSLIVTPSTAKVTLRGEAVDLEGININDLELMPGEEEEDAHRNSELPDYLQGLYLDEENSYYSLELRRSIPRVELVSIEPSRVQVKSVE